MELEYKPEERDLLALAKHQVATSPALHERLRKTHIGYVIGFSVLSVGAFLAIPSEAVSIAFAALASLCLLAYPSFFRWKLSRDLPTIVRRKATPASYAVRRLRALPDGLEQTTEGSSAKVRWDLVSAVFETPTHTFIAIDHSYSIAIPRDRIAAATYNSFIETVRGYRLAAG